VKIMWRVLVVEDDLLQGEHVCDLLVEEGMEPVGPAPTVKDALKLLDTTGVDAAILDIGLRNGLCFDVAHTLVARRVPFLFLTGSRRQVLPTNFRGVPIVHKPYEPTVLLEAVRRILSGEELPSNSARVGRCGGSLQSS
jgi:DNA-binding response OmpR family regulator